MVSLYWHKKDNDNNIQAASSLDISSGRATVKLTDSNQINPNNITWGIVGDVWI